VIGEIVIQDAKLIPMVAHAGVGFSVCCPRSAQMRSASTDLRKFFRSQGYTCCAGELAAKHDGFSRWGKRHMADRNQNAAEPHAVIITPVSMNDLIVIP
jgi:hypothetical protein